MTDSKQELPPLEPEAKDAMVHLLESLIEVLEMSHRDFEEWKNERTAFLNGTLT